MISKKISNKYFKYLVGVSALVILFVSAYFSIRGISQLFSGQRTTAMILAGSLEFAKISTTAYLTRNWKVINKAIRTYFIIATITLVLISSAGIFANLTDAYQETALKNEVVDVQAGSLVAEEMSLKERKIDLQYEIDSSSKEIELIRGSIQRNDIQTQNLYYQMEQDSTISWVGSIWEFKKQNELYKEEITKLRNNKEKARLEIVEINSKLQNVFSNIIENKSSENMNNIGPLKKLSILFNISMDTLVKYFIFIIIIVFDPLGILLIVAFNIMHINSPKKKKKKKKKKLTITKKTTETITAKKPKAIKPAAVARVDDRADIRQY